jgi:hypothetical protein
MDEKENHARVTPEGKALGLQLIRLTAPALIRLLIDGEPDGRCPTCAFRDGTVPNGCPQTTMDALKAVAEDVPFMCHHKQPKNTVPCHGWYAARVALKGAKFKVPYDFSHDSE